MSELGPSPLAAGDRTSAWPRPAPPSRRTHARDRTRSGALAAGTRPGAGRRRGLADRRAGARQLGDGRLCPCRRRAAQPTARPACCGGHRLCRHALGGAVAAGECLRIMTGAVMPAGLRHGGAAGAVTAADGCASVPGGHRKPARTAACRAKTWPAAAPRCGRSVLRPADLGLIASLGFPRVEVRGGCAWRCSPPATSCATPGQPLDPGCIYDSNRYSLLGALQRLGCRGHRPGPGARRPRRPAATLERAVAGPTRCSPAAA
jgi:hypothetical protein